MTSVGERSEPGGVCMRAEHVRRGYEWDCANFLALWTQLTAVDLSVCTLFIRMFTFINLVAPRKISITY